MNVRPKTVLVIEDEATVQEMICMTLDRFGFSTDLAVNGDEGIRMFDQGAYDLVITDIVMPGVDGNHVAQHIRNSSHTTPVIGMSGTPWLLETDNFDAVLPKPFHLKEFIERIDQLMADA